MRQLTPLMLPTSLQPSLTGPRDALRVHTIATPEDDAKPSSAPTKSKGSTMTNAQRILAALAKKSPADLTQLEKTTGISRAVLGVTLPLLVKQESIERSPNQRGVYGLLGTDFPGATDAPTKPAKAAKPSAPPPNRVEKRNTSTRAGGSFAAGVAQVEREMDAAAASGTRLVRADSAYPSGFMTPAQFLDQQANFEVTAIPPRAIQKADGGAIILRGNTLTAELDAESLAVIRQL